MKLKELYSPEICKVVDYFIPQEISEQGLIIAGGFASWLLYLHKTVDDWDKFFDDLESGFFQDPEKRTDIYEPTKSIGKFGDIDIWIPEGHALGDMDIIKSNDLYSKELSEKSLAEKKKHIEKSFLNSFGIRASLLKVSEYAYTYKITYKKRLKKAVTIPSFFLPFRDQDLEIPYGSSHEMRNSFQIIRVPAESFYKVFKSFDLHHTRVAFFNSTLYFTEKAESTYEEKMLYPTKYFLERNDSLAINCACRAFKYKERFGFNFSEALADKIADLYVEVGLSEDMSQFVGAPDYSVTNMFNASNLAPEYDPDYLMFFSEINEETLEKIKGIYLKRFFSFFKAFSKMPCFKDEYVGLLLCSEKEEIKRVIEELLYE